MGGKLPDQPLPKVNVMTEFPSMPYTASHQLITDMANSARETMALTTGIRGGLLEFCHAQRIHELMRYRSHTVNTDGF